MSIPENSSDTIDKLADEDYANRENWHLVSIFIVWAIQGFFAGFVQLSGQLDSRLAAGIIDAFFFGSMFTGIGAFSHKMDRQNSRKRVMRGIPPRKEGWAGTVWIIIVALILFINGGYFLQALEAVTHPIH